MTALSSGSRRFLTFARREPAVPAIYAVLAVVVALRVALDPSVLEPARATVVLAEALPLVLVSVGQTIVFLTRAIDLSVGGIVALSNAVIATQMGVGAIGMATGVALGLLVGVAAGTLNGLLVGVLRLPSIIVTLATWSILGGVTLYVLPTPGGSVPAEFGYVVLRTFGPVPFPLILMVALPLVLWWPIRRSRLGHAVYAVGGNEEAAYASGIPVARVKVFAFTMSGFFSALAAVFLTMQALSGDPRIGDPFTLNSLVAVVLGGTLLAGGRGGVLGTVAGALVFGTLSELFFLAGVSLYWQSVVAGAVLVVALTVTTLARRRTGAEVSE